jgi:cytochrome c oxidase cbb3-type subunit I/II
MPNYPWLFENKTDVAALPSKLRVQRLLGVPYPEMKPEAVQRAVATQEQAIVASLKEKEITIEPDREIVALIAYLQKLGKSEVVKKETPAGGQTAPQ